jgi:hypothetical protein
MNAVRLSMMNPLSPMTTRRAMLTSMASLVLAPGVYAQPLPQAQAKTLEPIAPEGYVIPSDLKVKAPPSGFGPVAASLSGWWKSVNVPSIFELELVLIFEEFKSAKEVQLVVAIKARRGKPGRTERVTAFIDGDVVTFVRNQDQKAVVRLTDATELHGKVEVSSRFPAIPATFRKAQLETKG